MLNALRLDTSGNVTSTETTSAPSTSASCTNQGCTLSMGNLRPSTTYTLFLGLDMGSSAFLLALVIVEITDKLVRSNIVECKFGQPPELVLPNKDRIKIFLPRNLSKVLHTIKIHQHPSTILPDISKVYFLGYCPHLPTIH